MDDVDDELLALAGGGESSDEGEASEREVRNGSASPSRSRKGAKKAAVAAKKSRRPQQGDDSEEEGEASSTPGTPNSLESAPMDESDSDAEPVPKDPAPSAPARASPPEDDENKYPVEGLYTSREEKEEIESMVEFEREQLLAERAAEVEKIRQNRILRQLVTNQELEERKKKRSADTAELDDRDRKSSRQRVNTKPGETTSAIDTLRRAKAEKNDRLRRREENLERQKDDSSPPRGRRNRSRSGSANLSPDRHRNQYESRENTYAVRESPPADLRDVERLRVGRHRFAEHCLTPGFAKAVTGCYVRISVGPHPDTGIDQYRMACIKEITTNRPYAMEGLGGIFVTDQYVQASHGSAAREFPFIACSDKPITEAEWNRYKVTCSNDSVDIPNKDYLVKKIADINALINHEWTDQQILAKVARKDELRRRFDPAERERLAKQILAAQEDDDAELAEKLQDRLDEISRSRLAFRTTLANKNASSSKGKSQQDRLAELNRENRRKNAENIRRAQLMEKAKTREVEVKLARGEISEKAALMMDSGMNEAEDAESGVGPLTTTTMSTADLLQRQEAMKVRLAKLHQEKYSKANGVPEFHKPIHDDDVIGSLDLDIDVEI